MSAEHSAEAANIPLRRWIVVLAGAGFSAGFFGPMALVPEANQGPMVGIFLSGPAGLVLALLLWGVVRALQLSAATQHQILWGSTALGVAVTLFCVLPEPEQLGRIVDFHVDRCRVVADAPDAQAAAFADWDQRIAQVTWAKPAPGWRAAATESLAHDRGLLLEGTLTRASTVVRHRKPWNAGRITARGFVVDGRAWSFYVAGADGSCADYPGASQRIGYTAYDLSALAPGAKNEWPPTAAGDLLNMQTLRAVPDEYQAFVTP